MSKKYAFLLGIFIVLYAVLTFTIPPDSTVLERFDVSILQLRFISLTILLPLVVIWFLAFYGFSKFKEYALKIIDNPDGRAFHTLANGLMVLALTLPISSLTSTALNYFSIMHPEFTAATVITDRYMGLGLAVAAFVLIYRGSKGLAALTTKKVSSNYVWSGAMVLIIGGLHAYFVLASTAVSTGQPVYYLPAWWIIATIVIPYAYIWYLGFRSAAFIWFYKKNVRGIVYGRALGSLTAGLGMVVGASIVTQLLTAISKQLANWGLQPLLVLVYLLIIVMAIGYILIAFGAKKLKKIEEA